jgi:histidine phosphotransferase ChpT
MTDPLTLAEFLCARLCHDISGPMSSIAGAIELAIEDETAREEALPVAGEAAVVLGRRLRLLRAAWSGDCGALDLGQVRQLAEGLPGIERLQLDTSQLDPEPPFSPGAARLLLNVMLLASESLPRGGIIALSGSAQEDVIATIDGPHAAWPTGLADCLADPSAVWAVMTSARTVQAPVTALIARHAGLRLSIMMPTGPGGSPAPLLLSLHPTA